MTDSTPTAGASVPAEGTWNQVFAEDAARSIDRNTTAATMIDVRTLGELRDAVARLIEAHGEALPVHSYNDGMGCPEVTLHVTDHHKIGRIVEVM